MTDDKKSADKIEAAAHKKVQNVIDLYAEEYMKLAAFYKEQGNLDLAKLYVSVSILLDNAAQNLMVAQKLLSEDAVEPEPEPIKGSVN